MIECLLQLRVRFDLRLFITLFDPEAHVTTDRPPGWITDIEDGEAVALSLALIRTGRDDVPVVGFFEDAAQFRMILRKFLMGEEGAGDAGSSAHRSRADAYQADQIGKDIDGTGIGMETGGGFRLADRDRRLGVITAAILDLVKTPVVSQRSSQVNAESEVVATQQVVIHPLQRRGRDANDSAAVVDLFTGAERQLLQAGHVRHVGMGHFIFDDLGGLVSPLLQLFDDSFIEFEGVLTTLIQFLLGPRRAGVRG